jgi:hypothetical protein
MKTLIRVPYMQVCLPDVDTRPKEEEEETSGDRSCRMGEDLKGGKVLGGGVIPALQFVCIWSLQESLQSGSAEPSHRMLLIENATPILELHCFIEYS